jgi:hypothetical protein
MLPIKTEPEWTDDDDLDTILKHHYTSKIHLTLLPSKIEALKNNRLFTLGDWKKLPKSERDQLSGVMSKYFIPVPLKVLLNKIAPPEEAASEDEFAKLNSFIEQY